MNARDTLRRLMCRIRGHDYEYTDEYEAMDGHVRADKVCNRCGDRGLAWTGPRAAVIRSLGFDVPMGPGVSATRNRVGPDSPGNPPYYCPWCQEQRHDNPLEHTYDHRDKAPYSYLVHEEFWPAGLAAHCIAEGVTA